MSKHIIWTNFELPEIGPMEREEYPGVSDDELPYVVNDDWLEDERENLDVDVGGTIVVFADLGLWYGRRSGYKILDGTRLSGVLRSWGDDYMEWYVEDGELKCCGAHHDGTNYYTYRVLKDQELLDRMGDEFGVDLKELMDKTEPLGDMVSKIYGWEMVG